MNRTDGLVRRTVKPRENGAEGGSTGGLNANTPDDNQDLNESNRDHEDNVDDGDSKETRLTLMEEVLLLGLKDKEVRVKRLLVLIRPQSTLVYQSQTLCSLFNNYRLSLIIFCE